VALLVSHRYAVGQPRMDGHGPGKPEYPVQSAPTHFGRLPVRAVDLAALSRLGTPAQGEVNLFRARGWARGAVESAVDDLAHVVEPPLGLTDAGLAAGLDAVGAGVVEREFQLVFHNHRGRV